MEKHLMYTFPSGSRRTMCAFVRQTIVPLFTVSCLLLFAGSPCWGQATVNEGQETASIYVDAAKGNDANSGSKTPPLKTIGASVQMALANNDSSIGSRVTINPGTYRESVVIGGTKRSTN